VWCADFASLDVLHRAGSAIPSKLWRGVGYSKALVSKYKRNEGHTIYLYNFMSTSRVMAQALRFAQQNQKDTAQPVVLEITVPSDAKEAMADVASMSEFQKEQEILIACNVGFRIDRVDESACRIYLSAVDVSRCLLGNLPNKLHKDCRQLVEDDDWATKRIASNA
jgi:hypothetical protein